MAVASRLLAELGITTLMHSRKDVWILLLTRFVRMFAYGSSTLILALFFAILGHSDTKIGLFMTLTLVGDVLISLALTFVADGLGRRNILVLGALLLTFSGAIFATCSNYWVLLLAAIVGVISPSGNEIGPFRAVEESTLAHLSEAKTRSDIFAWYVVFGTLGAAGGALACGWTTQGLQEHWGWTEIQSYRFIFWIYAGIGLIKASLNLFLSKACEPERKSDETETPMPTPTPTSIPVQAKQPHSTESSNDETRPLLSGQTTSPSSAANHHTATNNPKPRASSSPLAQISTASRRTLLKLCALMALDSLASGMVPPTWTTFYLSQKFAALPTGHLGTIMSSASFVSSLSNIFSSSIAKRLGLIPTMVFTHLPAAALLALLPVPRTLWPTIVVLVARSALSSLDQAPRTAFLAAVVLPTERTAMYGVVNTVKTAAQSCGPLVTGALAERGWFAVAFVVAGCLKAMYDLGLLAMFLGIKLDGERDAQGAEQQSRREEDGAVETAADETVGDPPETSRH